MINSTIQPVTKMLSTIGAKRWFRKNRVVLGRLSIAVPIIMELGVAIYKIGSKIRSGELKSYKQIKINWRKVAIGVAILGVSSLVGVGILGAIAANPWKMPGFMPKETTFNVYTGYLAMGAASFYRAKQAWGEDKKKAAFHVMMGVIAVAAPIVMGLGLYDTRWHHLSYGLICTLPGLRGVGAFGAAMSLESTMYWGQKWRSHFGYDNIFVDNIGGMVASLGVSTLMQLSSHVISIEPLSADKAAV